MTSSVLSTHIRYLLQSSDDADAASAVRELCEYVDYGPEASIVVLQVCLGYLTLHSTEGNKSQHEKVASTFKHFMRKPNFSSVFSHLLRNVEIKEDFLDNLANALCLSASESIRLGLAFFDSGTPDARTWGRSFCMAQIEKIFANPPVVSAELIRDIILFLQQFDDLSGHVDLILQYLSSTQSVEALRFVLTPILKEETRAGYLNRVKNVLDDSGEDEFDGILADMEKEMNVGDIIEELGYGFTVSSIQCKELLSQFLPLTEATISRILGTVSRTHVGLEDNQNAFSPFSSALGCGTLSDLPTPSSWNINNLVAKILELAPDTNWIRVIENLDYDGFRIPDMDAFVFFMSAYRIASQDPFPLHAVCGSVWKNSDGQLSFLQHAISAPSEVFTFAHSARKLDCGGVLEINEHQLGLANHAWLSLDVLDVLCQLAERGHASSIRLLLEHPLKHCPQVLLSGLAQINTAYNLIQHEVAAFVFPVVVKSSVVMKGSIDCGLLLHLWHVNPHLVIRGFLELGNMEPDNMFLIVEVCQEMMILSSVIEASPFSFGIRLAAVASHSGYLDLEKWLSNCVDTYKVLFFEECHKFVKDVQMNDFQDVPPKHIRLPSHIFKYYWGAVPVFVKFLKAHVDVVLSPQVSEEVEGLYEAYLHSCTMSQNGGAKDSTTSVGYGEDVEAEANSYFHQMFSGQLGIDAMVQMLERFKESPDLSREHAIYDCMVANLFEEYRFFPKYPERQLKLAAILFGSVIKHQLVTHIPLGIALRGVLDALRRPADSKMFVFGTKALEQFVNRLIEWPQYCNHILQISHLRSSHPELVVVIEQALSKISSGHSDSDRGNNAVPHISYSSQSYPGNGDQSSSSIQLQQRNEVSGDDHNKASSGISNDARPLLPPLIAPVVDSSVRQKNSIAGSSTLSASAGFVRPRGATSTRFGSALNIETLVAAADRREKPIAAPALEVQDKISFIINNISSANIEVKAKELTEILTEQYYPWFAQYMVMKRASIEPNFHDLYLKFLDKVNSKSLFKEIVQATYENCKVLLGSELIKSSSEERSLLKNLGSWLGKLTIGRNQVLRAREVDPKSLIVEAYEKGLMIAVIPFTSKILEPCQQSVAYQPPNPWTMGILGLLAEIYSMPNLKMNLKFDIEVLFKNLGVDMKDVLPTSLLKDRKRETLGNPDFSNKDTGVSQVSQPQMIPEIKSGTISSLSNVELPIEVASSPDSNHSKLLSQYAAPLHISSSLVVDDENLAALSVSNQLPSAQGLFQSVPTQSASTISQFSAAVPNIGSHVIINQKLSSLNMHLPFQRVVSLVMERAIKEIVSSIVERSVRIACQTTLELVLKDYASEPDETRIYNAAHLMVASLAGSLAHVTCKEPLRGSISNHLRISLQGLSTGSDVLEQVVQLVTNDNLDLGCAAIEQAATEEAIRTIDAEISRQLSSRAKHRDGAGSSFYDPNMLSQNSIGLVPEFLRPKPGHLSLSQQRIYEDFVQLPWQKPSSQNPPPLSAGLVSSSDASLSGAYGSSVTERPGSSYMSGAGNAGVDIVSQPLDIPAGGTESNSVSVLSATSPHVVPVGDTVNVQLPKPTHGAEFHSLESSDSSKELGGSSQALVSSATLERLGNSITNPSLTTRDALDKYQIIAQKLEDLVTDNAGDADIQALVTEVREIILRCVSRDEAALAVAQKAFKALYENASNSLHVGANLAILVAVRDVCKRVVKELTSWVIYSDDERKFNNYITLGLIQSELLNLAEYSFHMAKLIDGGRNKGATEFAISLLQCLVSDETKVISELHSLVDALAKLAAKPGSPESLEKLIESIRNPAFSSTCPSSVDAGSENDARQSKDEKDTGHAIANREEIGRVKPVESSGFRDQVSMLFAEWYKICNLPVVNDAACSHYVLQLHQTGLLKGDDTTERLFHNLMELSVAHCISSEVINSGTLQAPQQVMSFLAIDIYAKLVLSILKYTPVEQEFSKISLLSKIMTVTVRFIHNDAEEKKTMFNPRPYFRLFINWLLDLCSLDAATDGANFQILMAFANTFHNLQPLKVPAFSFAWLELVSHRSFLPKLLTGNGQKGWPYIQLLLVDLLKFLEPFLRNADLGEPVNHLYKGTLRVLLVLLHDFPEFICDYHFTFCDVIPPSCIQMRNIVLSSFPRNMRLPDPSTPNLKIDLLPEIHKPPRILSEVDAALKASQIKNDVDDYLMMRQQNSAFLSELKQKLLLQTNEAAFAGTRYNVPLINSLVLYVGMQAIQQLQAGATQSQSSANIGALQMFKTLSSDLDAEGRYLFLNAIANQLRYPNSHTHYFSFFMLYLFSESDQEIIQEQITRVLLERLIVNRPQPWGLHITFIELIKNQRYNFWKQNFIRCAPEIEKLFDSVARSCGGLKRMDEGIVSNWVSDSAH